MGSSLHCFTLQLSSTIKCKLATEIRTLVNQEKFRCFMFALEVLAVCVFRCGELS